MSAALTMAFRELRKAGYFCRQHWQCCQTCGWAAIPDDKRNHAVFAHHQDDDHYARTGELYLCWRGDGELISHTLRAHGLHVQWNGEPTARIVVSNHC